MRVIGLKRLNKEAIKVKAKEVLEYWNPNHFQYLCPTPVNKILQLLQEKHGLALEVDLPLGFDDNGNRRLGYFSPNPLTIAIDVALQQPEYANKLNFVAGHELGHLALHRKVIFEDVPGTPMTDTDITIGNADGKRLLITDIDFLEWQANYFSSVLLVPDLMLIHAVATVRKRLGLPGTPKIYVDNQPVTQKDFYDTVEELSVYFRVSRSVIRIRLDDLNLVDDRRAESRASRTRVIKSVLEELIQKRTQSNNNSQGIQS